MAKSRAEHIAIPLIDFYNIEVSLELETVR
jgi:hypothetical protein